MVPRGESNHSFMSKPSKMAGLEIMAAENSRSSNMANFLKKKKHPYMQMSYYLWYHMTESRSYYVIFVCK